MEISTGTQGTKVEIPHWQAVQSSKKKILGTVSKVNMKPKSEEQQKRRYAPPEYRLDDIIYITAFLKEEKSKYFICQASIVEVPKPDQRRLYKVKITAVADRAIGSLPTPIQACLLGRTITKRENEITREISPFMAPPQWIILEPG